jgi:hypothetical protein
VVSNWLLRHRIDTGDCVYSGCAMRLVTEQELKDIEQGVTLGDWLVGLGVAALTAAICYGCLLIGVG